MLMFQRAVAAMVLLGCTDAWAARRAEVAVVGLHISGQDDDGALTSADAVTEALEKTGSIDVVSPGEVRGLLAGRESLVVEGIFLGPGRRNLDEGRVLYERADFENAIPVLTDAANELQDGLAGATDSKDLIDALLLLGLAQASIGEQDAARAAFKRVAVLDPARELDAVNYPPKFVAMFSEVRDAVRALPPGKLQVQAPSSKATVYVDGLRQGEAPVTLPNLPPGTHYVLVIGEGGRRSFENIDLAPDEKRQYVAPLDTRALADTGDSDGVRSRQIRQLYASLGSYMTTTLVVIGGEQVDGSVAIQLYEPRTGNFSQILTSPAGADPVSAMCDLVPSLANYVTEDGTLRSDRVSPQTAALDIRTNAVLSSILLDPVPIVETITVTRGPPWYVWTGIAAVAAGGAAGAVLLLVPDDPGTTDPPPDPDQGTITVAIP